MKAPPFESLNYFLDNLANHYKHKKIFFEFTGGEPTLYRDFPKLLQWVKSKGHHQSLITNASKPLSYWREILPLIDHLQISFHHQRAEVDNILELLNFAPKNLSIHLSIMLEPVSFFKTLERVKPLIESRENLTYSLQPVLERENKGKFNYTKIMLNVLRKQVLSFGDNPKFIRDEYSLLSKPSFPYRGKMVLNEDSLEHTYSFDELLRLNKNWKGWNCHVGLEKLIIDASRDAPWRGSRRR